MSEYLPEAVRLGLEEARKAAQRKSKRLCVHVGEQVYRINRLWDGGFAMDARDAHKVRGHVQIYDGAKHLYQALVVASQEEGDEQVFEFKWHTAAVDGPAADFVRETEAPKGLLTFLRSSL